MHYVLVLIILIQFYEIMHYWDGIRLHLGGISMIAIISMIIMEIYGIITLYLFKTNFLNGISFVEVLLSIVLRFVMEIIAKYAALLANIINKTVNSRGSGLLAVNSSDLGGEEDTDKHVSSLNISEKSEAVDSCIRWLWWMGISCSKFYLHTVELVGVLVLLCIVLTDMIQIDVILIKLWQVVSICHVSCCVCLGVGVFCLCLFLFVLIVVLYNTIKGWN